jgi:c-di-AMP phosphodiesterase-like protein
MEHMGGGGHIYMAGSQMENATVEEAIAKVKEVINQMIIDGEIDA